MPDPGFFRSVIATKKPSRFAQRSWVTASEMVLGVLGIPMAEDLPVL